MSALISVAELAACYRDDNVVVADCRFALGDPGLGEREYRAGHIPGSRYLHLDRDLSGPKGVHGGRHPLPSVAALAAKLSALGIGSDPPTRVIAYDDSGFAFASRLWWLLRYLGHERVQVLDGGWRAWREAGMPVDTAAPAPVEARFVARPRPELLLDVEQIKTLSAAPDAVLVDSREERRFLGLEEPIDPVAGHIPGARNFPWQQVSDTAGFFRAPDEQRRRWGDAADQRQIAVYCGSGVTACVNLLALAEIGRADARLYAGSWSDWCSYPELAKSTGA